jgi:hypothetical protein
LQGSLHPPGRGGGVGCGQGLVGRLGTLPTRDQADPRPCFELGHAQVDLGYFQ